MKSFSQFVVLFTLAVGTLADTSNLQLLYEWAQLDFAWLSESQRYSYIADGRFIVDNNIVTGIKVHGQDVYVTVPRWRPGVPSTLNKLSTDGDGNTILQPYPSWQMQTVGDGSALQYVQSMEIDSRGWMWIVDVGRLNIYAPDVVVNGPPKLIVWDLVNNCSVREFVFPDDIAPWDNSFLNDIVVDETNGFAYIPDTWADGGIVVYDFNRNMARRWDDPSLQGNPDEVMTINGTQYPVTAPSDGIALSHDGLTLYYCAISQPYLYSIATELLQNFSLTDQEISAGVNKIGVKGFSDGLAFSSDGMLYYGSQEENALYVWDVTQPLSTATLLADDANTMQWLDTFAFDGVGGLLFTTNRLPEYLFGGLNFDGGDANFRIWNYTANAVSYLSGDPVPKSLPCLP